MVVSSIIVFYLLGLAVYILIVRKLLLNKDIYSDTGQYLAWEIVVTESRFYEIYDRLDDNDLFDSLNSITDNRWNNYQFLLNHSRNRDTAYRKFSSENRVYIQSLLFKTVFLLPLVIIALPSFPYVIPFIVFGFLTPMLASAAYYVILHELGRNRGYLYFSIAGSLMS